MKKHTFRFFFIPYLAALIVAFLVVNSVEHGDIVLYFNTWHRPFLNMFFRVWTYGGDGILFGIVALVLLIFRRKTGYIFLLVGLVQGLISSFLKRIVFSGTPRPRKYFEGQQLLDLIEGVKVHDFNSFPSGHTMTAFAIATFLTLVLANRVWAVILFGAATLVGISRIYLNQHFLVDVAVGSFIGVIVAYILFRVFEKYMIGETTQQ